MPKIAYQQCAFKKSTLEVIYAVNEIIDEFQDQGYQLTIRQLYYQLVSRSIITNTVYNYNNISTLVNNGRSAGLIDWHAVVDQTRHLRRTLHCESASDLIEKAMGSMVIDKWAYQPYYLEVWVQKDTLMGLVQRICSRWDVPCFSCRGYVSQSEIWAAAMRIISTERQVVIFHLGDHDPIGLDMSRDIFERLGQFGANPIFKRLALNSNQIEEYKPLQHPIKVTDSKYHEYIRRYGDQCWELDSLTPSVLTGLIQSGIDEYLDVKSFRRSTDAEMSEKAFIAKLATHLDDVKQYLDTK